MTLQRKANRPNFVINRSICQAVIDKSRIISKYRQNFFSKFMLLYIQKLFRTILYRLIKDNSY
jgi:hypothetical protein